MAEAARAMGGSHRPRGAVGILECRVRRCLAKLPAQMAAAFTLRTLDDCDPTEVCRELGISRSNLWVLLHRARLRLARCLQRNWFDEEEQRC